MLKTILKIILAALFILPGCQQHSSPKELIDRFNFNKPYFDTLVISLQNDKKLDSLFQIPPYSYMPDLADLYPEEFKLLNKIGITAASSHHGMCRICPRWYLLKTNWPSKHPVFVIYNSPGDSAENISGFYQIDKYKNETWGLGDKWKMFRFVDTITDVKQ
jgi:hypothetical protein